MECSEIDLRDLKRAVDGLLDHMIERLGVKKVAIAEQEDFYWDFDHSEMYDASKRPTELTVGRVSDDLDFVQKMLDDDGYVVLMLHVAPLLKYIATRVKEH